MKGRTLRERNVTSGREWKEGTTTCWVGSRVIHGTTKQEARRYRWTFEKNNAACFLKNTYVPVLSRRVAYAVSPRVTAGPKRDGLLFIANVYTTRVAPQTQTTETRLLFVLFTETRSRKLRVHGLVVFPERPASFLENRD
jgi:hypothetical protein